MIPLGLKETKEIDFREPFKDFILEHYSEDADEYENAIDRFSFFGVVTRYLLIIILPTWLRKSWKISLCSMKRSLFM